MKLETPPIFYIALDPERATGIEDMLENYHIICPYKSALTDSLKKRGISVFVLEEECSNAWENALEIGTYGIMQLQCVKEFIAEKSEGALPRILVLKNSTLIENFCKKSGWELWSPKSFVATVFENKISQFQKLQQY